MPCSILESKIYGALFGDEEAQAIFADATLVRYWCEVEIALAQAEAELGLVPSEAAQTIGRAIDPQAIDLQALREGTERVGYPILPLVRLLTDMVGEEAGQYLHWGATTQDIMDTALALQIRDLHALAGRWLNRLSAKVAELARAKKGVPLAGRTHGQQAVPVTLGFKFAVWFAEIERHRERWRQLESRIGFGQLSGAAGTLASLGETGLAIREGMCRQLGLKTPPISWHTARDVVAEIGSILGLLAGTLGKMAGEVANLQRNEIAELSEGFLPGRGSSSTMPQKRNPITSEVMVAQAAFIRQQVPLLTHAMTGLHERAMGEWQIEWMVLPDLAVLAVGLLKNACSLLENLVIDEEAMLRNLALSKGLIAAERVMMALAPFLGRQRAHEVVYAASAEAIDRKRPLRDVLAEHPEVMRHLTEETLSDLLDPVRYVGNAETFVEKTLKAADTDG